MQIAVIVPSLRDLAPVQVAITVAVHLARLGHAVTVYHISAAKAIPQPPEIRFEKISFYGRFAWHKYDIIHTHGFLPDAFVTLRKPFSCKAKTISTIHNHVFTDLKMLYSPIFASPLALTWLMVWRRMDRLVVLTDDALQYYASKFNAKKLSRIYNGKNITPDPSIIVAEHQLQIEAMRKKFNHVIGVYAALVTRKRIDILIRHLSRVKSGCLVIIGDGPERNNLKHLVATLGLQDRVKFLGYISQAHQYNAIFDISAHPSISEGFSLSLIEAALHKKRIICSDIPSFTEAFTDEEVTFFDQHDELSIDHAIQDALQDSHKPINAFNKAKTYYTEEKMAAQYELLFSSLNKL